MKALTLTQPHATLVAIQAKRIETRGWQTAYRGPLAIHAAKAFPKSARDKCAEVEFWTALMPDHLDWERTWMNIPKSLLPLGCIVATCQLVEIMPTEVLANRAITPKIVTEQELAFGDYSPGRWGWILEDVQMLEEPIPAKGALSLWEWETGQQERKKQA